MLAFANIIRFPESLKSPFTIQFKCFKVFALHINLKKYVNKFSRKDSRAPPNNNEKKRKYLFFAVSEIANQQKYNMFLRFTVELKKTVA
jgi:hypothetical protein